MIVTRASAALMVFAALSAWAQDPACRSDSECIISTSEPCCGSCCASGPRAVSMAAEQRRRGMCAAVDCSMPTCAPNRKCKPTEDPSTLRAVCEAGECIAVKKAGAVRPSSWCEHDNDCVVGPKELCCSTECCATPIVRTRQELTQAENVCALKECQSVQCVAKCAPSAFESTAVCRSHQCELVHKENAECRTASDCMVTSEAAANASCRSSPCGCCSGPPRAEPKEGAHRAPPPPSTPPFGLSTGKPTAPTPSCSPCPSISFPPASADCEAGRCVLVPMTRLR